jgi:hypothetical protein
MIVSGAGQMSDTQCTYLDAVSFQKNRIQPLCVDELIREIDSEEVNQQ